VTLRLHNTLTGTKDVFEPLVAGRAGIYTCGPTVWNFAHLGNWRAFLFYDLLRRHLKQHGLAVTHVMNLTDIDDRILDQAMHAGVTIGEFVAPYVDAFFEDMDTLRAQRAEHHPRATETIPEMVNLITAQRAYEANSKAITTADEIPDPGNLRLRTWVNGELRQESSTGDLIFGCQELVEFISQTCTLEPGDLILTGTPSGVGMGMDPPQFLTSGDVVRIEIDGLGYIEHAVA